MVAWQSGDRSVSVVSGGALCSDGSAGLEPTDRRLVATIRSGGGARCALLGDETLPIPSIARVSSMDPPSAPSAAPMGLRRAAMPTRAKNGRPSRVCGTLVQSGAVEGCSS